MSDSKFQYPPESTIKMLLGSTKKVVLLLEGDIDNRFFSTALNNRNVRNVVCDGRDSIINNMLLFRPNNLGRIFGICDSDFLNLGIGKHTGEDIFHTEFHDLEVDCLAYGTFVSYVGMCCNPKKLEDDNLSADDLIDCAIQLALPIGYLRLLNEIEDEKERKITFFDYRLKEDKVCNSNYQPNEVGLIETILNHNDNRHLLPTHKAEILEKLPELKTAYPDNLQVCNGHDFVKAIELLLKKYRNSHSTMHKSQSIQNGLLTSYSRDSFNQSKLREKLPSAI